MADHEATTPILSNTLYDIIKNAAQYWLPAGGTLYFGLSSIWGEAVFPNPGEVIGTITAVDIFLGAVLGLTKNSYKNSEAAVDGEIALNPATGVAEIQLKDDKTAEKGVVTLRLPDSQ
jgi:hypothetical protein